jgi:hypothetical protein
MLGVLANRTYRHLFLAQVVSLVGTGLAGRARTALPSISRATGPARCSHALAIKMIAYVGRSGRRGLRRTLPRRTMLVALDLVRAVVALACRS